MSQDAGNAKNGVKKMASSKEFLRFILEQLSGLDDISYRPMMGEYIIYYRGKIVGGIYDDRLLVKKTKSALKLMPTAVCGVPYDGAKEMLSKSARKLPKGKSTSLSFSGILYRLSRTTPTLRHYSESPRFTIFR